MCAVIVAMVALGAWWNKLDHLGQADGKGSQKARVGLSGM
jgi:hypothetical protein